MSAPPRPDVDADDRPDSGRRRSSSGTSGKRRKRRSWARRRHLGLITTGFALLVLVAGVLYVVSTWDNGRVPLSRQTSGVPTAVPTLPSATAPSSPTPSVSSAPGDITVRGTIAAVGDSRWTLTGNTGITYTVLVTPDTKLPRKRDFGSFVVGQVVSVKGSLDSGTITAASVAAGR